MKKQRFIVTIGGTDVPPDWPEKVEARLRKELKLVFGDNVEVERE